MKIKISHLNPGVHEFQLGTKSEACGIEETTIFRDPIEVGVTLQKFQQNLIVDLTVKTIAHYFCDRCLEEFASKVETKDRITFSMDEGLLKDSQNEIRELGPNDIDIDLSSDIRELLLLAIPTKAVCKVDCAGLCVGCGTNLNLEKCKCQKTYVDPRWDALKKLIN